MSGRTITRAYLSEIVYQVVGLSRNESAELLESVLGEICEALGADPVAAFTRFVRARAADSADMEQFRKPHRK